MSQLTADCLEEIFEYLENDRITLYSCLLVNRLWCKISVRILWRKIRNYNTLIACLPNESKEILYKNKIKFSTSTSKPPIFNYVSFCKILLVYDIYHNIRKLLKKQPHVSAQNLDDYEHIVLQEIFKLLMSQISSLKRLTLYDKSLVKNIPFASYPGAIDCLKDLSELNCDSDISSEFFYQLSKICHNIQILFITFEMVISNGLVDLISAQKNLECMSIYRTYCEDSKDIITLLEKVPNTLVRLNISGGRQHIPLSFIANCTNLQKLILSFENISSFEDFKKLQYTNFSRLQSLIFYDKFPRDELFINFLENNGKNLKLFYIKKSNDSLNSAIIKFCPNIRELMIGLKINELETLKVFFNSLQYLERVNIRCDEGFFSEKNLFDIVVKYSPKNFYE